MSKIVPKINEKTLSGFLFERETIKIALNINPTPKKLESIKYGIKVLYVSQHWILNNEEQTFKWKWENGKVSIHTALSSLIKR